MSKQQQQLVEKEKKMKELEGLVTELRVSDCTAVTCEIVDTQRVCWCYRWQNSLVEEKKRSADEAEDLTQEMAELRFELTERLEDEKRRRAETEDDCVRRVQELETTVRPRCCLSQPETAALLIILLGIASWQSQRSVWQSCRQSRPLRWPQWRRERQVCG